MQLSQLLTFPAFHPHCQFLSLKLWSSSLSFWRSSPTPLKQWFQFCCSTIPSPSCLHLIQRQKNRAGWNLLVVLIEIHFLDELLFAVNKTGNRNQDSVFCICLLWRVQNSLRFSIFLLWTICLFGLGLGVCVCISMPSSNSVNISKVDIKTEWWLKL